MAVKDAVGAYGERVARRHVDDLGWPVLATNWRSPLRDLPGELDLVAVDGTTLVVIEVKTRRGVSHGSPLEAVTPRKLARLRRLAGVWLASTRETDAPVDAQAVRIDVVGVRLMPTGRPSVVHLRNAG